MTKREVVKLVFKGQRPPYVPWSFRFTVPAHERLLAHYGEVDLEEALDNHFVGLGDEIGFFTDIGNDRHRDVFGVVWDRTIDKDIGNVEGCVLEEPTLSGYEFPDPVAPRYFESIPELIDRYPDRFRVFAVGFSLYERAWTLRSMENLLMDFHDHPQFVHELMDAIAEWNIAQVKEAVIWGSNPDVPGYRLLKKRLLSWKQDRSATSLKPSLDIT